MDDTGTSSAPPSGSNEHTSLLVVSWLLAIVTIGYFLPWAVAVTRKMPNQSAIGLLNLLLGWTIIGWVIALVMACAQRRA